MEFNNENAINAVQNGMVLWDATVNASEEQNKKAQLSLTNPRDAKACRNCFNSACLQRCR